MKMSALVWKEENDIFQLDLQVSSDWSACYDHDPIGIKGKIGLEFSEKMMFNRAQLPAFITEGIYAFEVSGCHARRTAYMAYQRITFTAIKENK